MYRSELFLDHAETAFALAFGHGYLWTLSRRDPLTNQHSVIARYRPDSAERPARLDIEGAAEGVGIGTDAVWIRCHRLDSDGELHTFAVRVGAEALDMAAREISNDETFFAVAREIWFGPTLLAHDPEIPPDIRRVEGMTWEDVGVIRPPGLVTKLCAGSSGIWGMLRPTPGSAPSVCRIDPDASSSVDVLDLAGVDARPFLPPHPPH